MPLPPKYSFIIVGSGTAGSLLASQLSKFSSVLLLESGAFSSQIRTPWLSIPLGYLYTMTDRKTSWMYKTRVGERVIDYPRGRVTGGCSAINGMIYQRGNRGDFEEW